MAKKKYCNRCAHDMWYDETAKRWYCTNKKCVKYKEQPKEEPVEPTPETPSEPTATPSEGNTAPTTETPSTGEPVQPDSDSATNTADGGNTETEPTP